MNEPAPNDPARGEERPLSSYKSPFGLRDRRLSTHLVPDRPIPMAEAEPLPGDEEAR